MSSHFFIKMKFRALILAAISMLSSVFIAEAGDALAFRNLRHGLEVNVRPSYIMPTHVLYLDHNSKGERLYFSGSAHLQYSFAFSPESDYGRLFPGTVQGIGLGANTFLCHKDIGSPVSLYIFQRGRIFNISEQLTFNYEWNLGLSFGWHQNTAIVSRTNAYVNVGLLADWKISRFCSLVFGPDYSHFSNGDTRYPNGGANVVGLRFGARADLNPGAGSDSGSFIREWENDLRSKSFGERISYDIVAYGAWRADRQPKGRDMFVINKAFPVAGLNFNPLYRFTRHISAGASLDLMYDGSANLYGHVVDEQSETVISFRRPAFYEQVSAGLSLRAELAMPVFSVNLGAGYNFLRSGYDMHPLYAMFNLKTFVSDDFFLLIGYRLSVLQYTHNLMFGIGFRI